MVKEDILVGWEEGEWEGPQIRNSVIKSVSRRRRGYKASSCRKLNSPPLSTLFKRSGGGQVSFKARMRGI
jgi:hypothetical protein